MAVHPIPSRRQWLRSASALAASSLIGASPSRARNAKPPNIVFILADDLGCADLGVYGQTDYQTPHLDLLAAQGLRLTQAYANSAVCSATRFGLITGRYQYRLRGGLEEPIAGASDTVGLPPGHATLPSLLKRAGYATALFGKWHLGHLPSFGPLKSGYDRFFGNYGGAIDYFTHKPGVGDKVKEDLFEGEVPVHQVGYYTDLLSERASDYLRERKAAAQPFFLSLHFTAPHWPWEGPGDEAVSREIGNIFHYDGGNLATYARMVTALDAAVGRVLEGLRQQGLAEDTIVIFTSDNGGERFSRTWPFSGQKTELLEGGIRVPAIVRWPRRLGAGQVTEQVAISMDWLPTLLAAAGSAPDPAYPPDGQNLLPVLAGKQVPVERTLFWRYKANAQRAVRAGNWKYLRLNGNEFLFDVAVDQRERANLAQRHPEVLQKLKGEWERWNAGMLAITPDVRTHGVNGKVQADHYHADGSD
jgi:arylsulfatase A-like enzyme